MADHVIGEQVVTVERPRLHIAVVSPGHLAHQGDQHAGQPPVDGPVGERGD